MKQQELGVISSSSFLVSVLGGIALASGSYYCLLHILNPSSVLGSMFYMTIGGWTLLLCYWDQVDHYVRLLILSTAEDKPLNNRYIVHYLDIIHLHSSTHQ